MTAGYVRTHRKVYCHPMFRSKIEASIFIWMFTMAAHKKAAVTFKGKDITLERGQLAISTRDIANEWGLTHGVVRGFLSRISGQNSNTPDDTLIRTANNTGITIVTICNYDKYQASEKTINTANRTANSAANNTQNNSRDISLSLRDKDISTGVGSEIPSPDELEEPDWAVILFGESCQMLMEQTKLSKPRAAALIGKWRKQARDDRYLVTLLFDCFQERRKNPVAYVQYRLNDEKPERVFAVM